MLKMDIWLSLIALLTIISLRGVLNQTPVVGTIKTKVLIPNLPHHHYQFWLKNHPKAFQEFKQICAQVSNTIEAVDKENFHLLHQNLSFEDPLYLKDLDYGRVVLSNICSKIDIVMKSCWGYENNCQLIHLMPECHGSSFGQAKNKQEQKITWFNQADFGYILERRREMTKYCAPDKSSNDSFKSSFECTKYFRTCRGENLVIDFEDTGKKQNLEKTLTKVSKIGGWNCDLQLKRIQEEEGQIEYLQSWFKEFGDYSLLHDADPAKSCDVIEEKLVYFIKLDSTKDIYHYFSNFLNLYATVHLNNRFSDDNQIVIWDGKLPDSKYDSMWLAFSRNLPITLKEYKGKRICFKKFISSFLPRMVDGLLHKTSLIPGCSKTGLFNAFNKHVLHRLGVKGRYDLKYHTDTKNKPIRTTIITRSTSQRKIQNLKELLSVISNKSTDHQVQPFDVDFAPLSLILNTIQNTDILIGLHGSELTYTLFLPDWAALYELHDSKSKRYQDLSQVLGVSYSTSSDEENFFTKYPTEDANKTEHSRNQDMYYEINLDKFKSTFEKVVEKVKENRIKYFKDLEKSLHDPFNENESSTETIGKDSNNHDEL